MRGVVLFRDACGCATRSSFAYAAPMVRIGARNTLRVVRETFSGLYVDGGELGEILLPGRLIPRIPDADGVARTPVAGDELEVFIYRDSEDRLVATTETPLAEVGGFAAMRVKDLHPRAGAFLDWGLSKDLLLPYREQRPHVSVGEVVVVAVQLDGETGRVFASTDLERFLSRARPPYRDGDAVDLLVYAESDLGYNAIVDNRFRGLLYRTNLAGPLALGSRFKGFVRTVREDGKLDLSLDASGYGRVAPLTETILDQLARAGGRLNFDDSSDPEAIRARFGASKKAFKQALGALYRARRIAFTNPGIEAVGPAEGRSSDRHPSDRRR
jgi:predicted RNA-binding protein (virulence factor B family)